MEPCSVENPDPATPPQVVVIGSTQNGLPLILGDGAGRGGGGGGGGTDDHGPKATLPLAGQGSQRPVATGRN